MCQTQRFGRFRPSAITFQSSGRPEKRPPLISALCVIMMNIKRIIGIWGILDFCSIGWYLLWRILHGQMPFYADITASVDTARSFEHPSPIIITIISLLLNLTLIYSGCLLYYQKPIAAIVVYIQTPFRLITLIPPSVFFITWPLKYIFNNPKAISAIITFVTLILLSESLKTYSIFVWRRRFASA